MPTGYQLDELTRTLIAEYLPTSVGFEVRMLRVLCLEGKMGCETLISKLFPNLRCDFENAQINLT